MKDKGWILSLLFIFLLSILIIINISIKSDDTPNKITLNGNWLYSVNDSPDFMITDYEDSTWKEAPFIYTDVIVKKEQEKVNKVIWFRKKIFIPKELKEEDLMLYVQRMANYHSVYFNGNLIGKTIADTHNLFSNWNKKIGYFIPKKLIVYGQENIIAIRTHSTYEYGP
ncbi:Glycosyl hydrolases family 2, sugar binding domain [Desulfonispora thiosulfatigenes DSM 11270]|uniref:Glycosyl hydrolases family 2, sugar binding domain n=1 Tax=Desulfonispora thiosulfatigenes DSM 11270 TaxID=656914 RepID=A0A1W1UDS2_DESTI|nr:beta galactosidase jelly roll domain-containing protein [Desulfonispora thiosulfatigenes]SMB79256.1 Glycosyl hydrolases family 2, sugar binding domain [Desulfonispora thiosulfatigenes DSM 11270]